MALDTFAALKTAIADWLHRDDLTSAIPDFITLAETRIFRDLRSKDMETAFSTAIASGTIATPAKYIDLKFAYVDRTPIQWLDRKTAKWIYTNYPTRSSTSLPKFIGRDASTFVFGPYPDSTYTITGVYYKDIGPLSSSAHTVFTNNPDLYLFGALQEAAPFMRNDARVMLWEAKYKGALIAAQGVADREDVSGGPLRSVPQ